MLGQDKREIAAVFVGGATGTAARAALSTVLPSAAGHWPWSTFGVNVAGAFLLGFFTTRLLERLPLSSYRRPLLGTGVCGGLTTFSTMQVEIVRMLDGRFFGLALVYTVVRITAGLTAMGAASTLVRRVGIGSRK